MSVRKLTHHTIGSHAVFLPVNNRRAWSTDSSNAEIQSPIVVPAEWAIVFSEGANPFTEPLSIFIGPKGVGKSTLLHLKRAIVEGWVGGFPGISNVVCLPAQDDMLSYRSPRGQNIRIQADSPEGRLFSSQNAWIALWRLMLATLVLQADFERRSRAAAAFRKGDMAAQRDDSAILPQVPAKVWDLFGATQQRIEPTDIARCLNAAVRKKGLTEGAMLDLYEQELLPLLRKHIGATRYCMFVDAIDEHIESDERLLIEVIQQGWLESSSEVDSTTPQDYQNSYNVWANAQAGLVLAATDLFEDTGRKVRVYAPIRSEAFHAAASRVAEAQLTTCAHVNYSREKLETIIRLNMAIDLEHHSKERLFGDDGLITEDQLARVDDVFFNGHAHYRSYRLVDRSWVSEMVRFSMERPREVMMIGRAISRSAQPDIGSMVPSEILVAMQSPLPEILKQFLNFIVGRSVANEFSQTVFPFIRSNVLSYAELVRIQEEADKAQTQLDHPMCKLYSMGLLGDVKEPLETGVPIQRFAFRLAGQFGGSPIRLPRDARHFVVHPVLASVLATIGASRVGNWLPPYRPNESCPIGNNLPWGSGPNGPKFVLELRALPANPLVTVNGAVILGQAAKRNKHGRGRRENRVATPNSRPNVLLVGWLYTIARLGRDIVRLDDVVESVKLLADRQFIRPRMKTTREVKGEGRTRTVSIPVATAVKQMVEGMEDSHDVIVDIRRFLQDLIGLEDSIRCIEISNGVVALVSSVVSGASVTLLEPTNAASAAARSS